VTQTKENEMTTTVILTVALMNAATVAVGVWVAICASPVAKAWKDGQGTKHLRSIIGDRVWAIKRKLGR
jgi:hypothetical protein